MNCYIYIFIIFWLHVEYSWCTQSAGVAVLVLTIWVWFRRCFHLSTSIVQFLFELFQWNVAQPGMIWQQFGGSPHFFMKWQQLLTSVFLNRMTEVGGPIGISMYV